MRVCSTWCVRSLVMALLLGLGLGPGVVQAQDKHVVRLDELSRDAARPVQTRQANEAALRQLFSSEPAQKALKSANIDYARVDKAIGQVSDEDLAKLAERSRQVNQDFAAGRAGSLSDRDLLIIVIVAVLLIALIAVLK